MSAQCGKFVTAWKLPKIDHPCARVKPIPTSSRDQLLIGMKCNTKNLPRENGENKRLSSAFDFGNPNKWVGTRGGKILAVRAKNRLKNHVRVAMKGLSFLFLRPVPNVH